MKPKMAWETTATTSSNRVNLFSKKGSERHHIATITSGSSKNLQRFDESITLIKTAPELLDLLFHTQKILHDYSFVQAAEVQQLERKISTALNALNAVSLITPK